MRTRLRVHYSNIFATIPSCLFKINKNFMNYYRINWIFDMIVLYTNMLSPFRIVRNNILLILCILWIFPCFFLTSFLSYLYTCHFGPCFLRISISWAIVQRLVNRIDWSKLLWYIFIISIPFKKNFEPQIFGF